jgi:hypothetical protein
MTTNSFYKIRHSLSTYSAVSYTWDGQNRDCYILCNGKPLKVTRNCKNILRNVQMRFVPIVLWIDAICIDQDWTEEKDTQGPLMSEIYKRAFSVKLWLGGSSPGARLVYNYMYLD